MKLNDLYVTVRFVFVGFVDSQREQRLFLGTVLTNLSLYCEEVIILAVRTEFLDTTWTSFGFGILSTVTKMA